MPSRKAGESRTNDAAPARRAVAEAYCGRYNLLVHTVFILVFSFVAYATGAIACKRFSSSHPSAIVHPAEMFLVVCLLVVIAVLKPSHYSATYHAVAAVAMLILGAVIARITLVTEGRASAGTREFEGSIEEVPASLWKRWLNFSHAVVDYEFRLFLVAIYLFVIGPFAIMFRLLEKIPASASSSSNWTPRNDSASMDTARRPF
jgi:hypothetical protein